jgi:hypothetical protein
VLRQDLARGLTQTHCTDGEDSNCEIKDYTDYEYQHPRHHAHRGPIYESIPVARGKRMQINFQIPAKCQQRENPKIISAQSPSYSFPFSDREMWCEEIRRQMFDPRFVWWNAVGRKQLREVTGLDDAYAA